jgi:hypothetical protein
MRKHNPTWLLLGAMLLGWTSLSMGDTAATVARTSASADPSFDMIAALEAVSPHPSLGDQEKVFGRFVGTWDVEYTDFSKDGKVSHRSGELIVGWVMDGRAIQDLWIVYPSQGRKDREIYTDVRYFDPKSGTWPATFIDPEHASVARFTGGAMADDRIVLTSQDFDNQETRWSFNDIRPDTFVFHDEQSSDGGKTWRLQSEYHMKRRSLRSHALWAPRL